MRYVIQGGEVLDETGVARPADLLIEGQRISAIDKTIDIEDTATSRIDARGMTTIAGFIDVHVHLSLAGESALPDQLPRLTIRAVDNAAKLLRAGVTSARDLGGFDGVAVAVQEAVDEGRIPGPALQVANQIVCATGGHGNSIMGVGCTADGPDGIRQAVRKQARAGATVIKFTLNGARNRVELNHSEVDALIEEAHRLGLRVACHASTAEAVALAVELRVDTVEHGNGASGATLEAMARQDTVLVPTASAFQVGLAAAQRLAASSPERRAAQAVEVWQRRVEDQHRLIGAALRAGVTVAVGSDAIPGQAADAFADEVAALADLGLSASQAVSAGTEGGAAALGNRDLARLRPRAVADLVVVAVPAARVLSGLAAPTLVFRAGRLVVDRRAAEAPHTT